MKKNNLSQFVKPKNYNPSYNICEIFEPNQKATQFVQKLKHRPNIVIIDSISSRNYNIEKRLLSTVYF